MAPQNRAANAKSRRRGQPALPAPAPAPAPAPPVPPAPPMHGATRAHERRRTHAAYVEDAPDEEFNLNDILGDEEEESVPPRARTRVRAPDDPPAINDDPLLNATDLASRSQSSSTADIEYFFKRERDLDTICTHCRDARAKDVAAWDAIYGPSSKRRGFTYAKATGNSSLRPHIYKWHLLEYLTQALENSWPIVVKEVRMLQTQGFSIEEMKAHVEKGGDLTSLPPRQNAGAASGPRDRSSVPEFSVSTFHQFLLSFIVADDQALNLVDCIEFRRLLLLLREDLQEQDIPHRTKLREQIMRAWKDHFAELKADLERALGDISLTADIWSNSARSPFLALTAHWIAEVENTSSLELKAALIAFHRIKGSHTGKSLARTILYLIDRAGITVKIGHVTLDNAENNATMMQELRRLLGEREIEFNARDRRIMCFPHIINICVKHVLDAFSGMDPADLADAFVDAFAVIDPADLADAFAGTSADDTDGNGEDSDSDSEDSDSDSEDSDNDSEGSDNDSEKCKKKLEKKFRKKYLETVENDPIALGRQIVKAIRASGLRRDAFTHTIKSHNSNDLFKVQGEVVHVPEHQLLRDVATRWDSVYFMINRLRAMRVAIHYFLSSPERQDIAQHKMNSMEWFVLRDFEDILKVPHEVQQSMSSESRPRLSNAVPHFELFMTAWEKKAQATPRLQPFIDVGLEWAKKYYKRMDNTRAYVVAMFVDPSLRMKWIESCWDKIWIQDAKKKIIELMKHYRETKIPQTQEQQAVPESRMSSINALALRYGITDLGLRSRPQNGSRTVEEEYHSYTTADLFENGLDPLRFWEMKKMEYPTIFQMAMDYLPIQASAVPCERVFSSSAETDTKKRNRISPRLMEALQMVKFRLKKDRLNFTRGWITSQKLLLDDEPDELGTHNMSAQHDPLDRILAMIMQEEGDGVPDAVELVDMPEKESET